MKLNLEAHRPFPDSDYSLSYGNMIIKDSKIVKFIENENKHFLETLGISIFPFKKCEYLVNFLDEYDNNYKSFQATIQIKDNLLFFIKLNYFQKLKLKWMLKSYIIQSDDMKKELLKYFIGGLIGLIFGFFSHLIIQKYNSERQITTKVSLRKSL